MSSNPFRYFKTSPEIIRLAVMLYVRFPLSPRDVTNCRKCEGRKGLMAPRSSGSIVLAPLNAAGGNRLRIRRFHGFAPFVYPT